MDYFRYMRKRVKFDSAMPSLRRYVFDVGLRKVAIIAFELSVLFFTVQTPTLLGYCWPVISSSGKCHDGLESCGAKSGHKPENDPHNDCGGKRPS